MLAPDDARVPAGVSIAGIPVGGLTAAQAERVVAAPSRRRARSRSALPASRASRCGSRSPSSRPRAGLAVQAAMRQPSLADRFLSEIGVRERTRDLPLRYRPDPAALDARVAALAAQLDRPAVPAKVVVRSSNLEIAASADGRAVDRPELRRRLARLRAGSRSR